MKTISNGYHRRFKAARLVFCVILITAMAGGIATPVQASGGFTHNEVVRMALSGNYGNLPPDLVTLLKNYPGAVESGSMFPDWGMAVRILPTDTDEWDNLAEAAHHQNFVDGYLKYMLSNFSPPYSEDELKAIAFYFGLLSHNTADPAFHNGFVPVAKENEWFDISGDDHLEIEQAVDSFNYGRTHCGLFCPILVDYGVDWFLPEEPILAAYSEPGVIDPGFNPLPAPPDGGSLAFGWGEYKTRSMYQIGIAWNTYGRGDFLQRLHWTYLNYYNYPNGGTEDQARQTVIKWNETWDSLTKPVTTIGLSPAQPDGNNGWYRQPVTITLSAVVPVELEGEIVTWYSLDGGGTYQQYTQPFMVSTEGENHISYYSVYSSVNFEAAKNLALKIDLTPPVVNVWVDQPRYMRTEPFVVHFNGADAISGMASLTAEFDDQPVTNGQTVDLFLLPLGSYTLTARGEDLAGWVTETSQSIEVYASIEGLQGTVDRLCQEKSITKSGICKELSAKLNAALAARDRGNLKAAANLLKAFQHAVKAQMDKSILGDGPWLLMMDSDYVIADLSR